MISFQPPSYLKLIVPLISRTLRCLFSPLTSSATSSQSRSRLTTFSPPSLSKIGIPQCPVLGLLFCWIQTYPHSDFTKACRSKCHLYWCLPRSTSPGLISPLEVQMQNPAAFLIPLCDCLIGTSNLYLKLSSILHLPVFPISLNNFILTTTQGSQLGVMLACFCLPSSYNQFFCKSCWLYLQNISSIQTLLTTSPKATLVQAFIILILCTTIIWTGHPATALSSLGVFWQHSRHFFVCFCCIFFFPQFLVNVSINLFSVFLKNKTTSLALII